MSIFTAEVNSFNTHENGVAYIKMSRSYDITSQGLIGSQATQTHTLISRRIPHFLARNQLLTQRKSARMKTIVQAEQPTFKCDKNHHFQRIFICGRA